MKPIGESVMNAIDVTARCAAISITDHAVTIERFTSMSWVEDDDSPAQVVRWVCSCSARGHEHHHDNIRRCLGAAKKHINVVLRRSAAKSEAS